MALFPEVILIIIPHLFFKTRNSPKGMRNFPAMSTFLYICLWRSYGLKCAGRTDELWSLVNEVFIETEFWDAMKEEPQQRLQHPPYITDQDERGLAPAPLTPASPSPRASWPRPRGGGLRNMSSCASPLGRRLSLGLTLGLCTARSGCPIIVVFLRHFCLPDTGPWQLKHLMKIALKCVMCHK